MKLNTVIYKYLFKEMLAPFFINVIFFAFVFLLTRILDITNMIVNYKIAVSDVLLIILYSMPHFLIFVIPISVMMTTLLTFLRLSGDNEIIALKAGGVSLYELLPPVFMFCLVGCLLTAGMTVYGSPRGTTALKELTVEVAASNVNIGLKERTFNDYFKDVMIYVNKINAKDKSLTDVFIEDQRNKNLVITIVSPRGELFNEPDKPVFHLRLFNGTVSQVDLENRSVNSIHFETYEVSLDLAGTLSTTKVRKKNRKEMNLDELRQYIKEDTKKDAQYYVILLEWHKRFSIPFACFALGLLAVPLGVRSKSVRRSFGLGLGLAFFLFYYLLLSAGMVFGEAGVYPPLVGMWVPNIVTGGMGLYFLVRTANDRPIWINFFSKSNHNTLKIFGYSVTPFHAETSEGLCESVRCQVLSVRKNYKTFIVRCDRQLMPVYMGESPALVARSAT